MSENKTPPPFNFIASPDLKSEYANLVRIAHSPVEFVVECARLLPGEVHPLIVSKVVLSPLAIKMFRKPWLRTFHDLKAPSARFPCPA